LSGGDRVEDEVELLGELTSLSSNGSERDSPLRIELILVRLVSCSKPIEGADPLLKIPNDVCCPREVRVVERVDEALESLRPLLLKLVLVEKKIRDDVVESSEVLGRSADGEARDVDGDEILKKRRGREEVRVRIE